MRIYSFYPRGISRRSVSVCLSVCHMQVLYQLTRRFKVLSLYIN